MMSSSLSSTELWEELRPCFTTDDGSLPTIEIQHLTETEVGQLYLAIREGSRVVSQEATFWDSSAEKDCSLDDVSNAAFLVADGQASPFHFAIGVGGTPEVQMPCLGVHIFQDSIAIDFRMGKEWGKDEVWSFFSWLRSLLSKTRGGALNIGAEGPPEPERFMRAWSRFVAHSIEDGGCR